MNQKNNRQQSRAEIATLKSEQSIYTNISTKEKNPKDGTSKIPSTHVYPGQGADDYGAWEENERLWRSAH